MNQRERMLAIVVGVLVAGACLYYGGTKIANVFISRSDAIDKLNEEIEMKEEQRVRGMLARRLLDEYSSRALPGDEVLADSRYRAWLHEWVESADVTGADVQWVTRQQITVDKETTHDVHKFSVICQGNLPQMVEMLYKFYSQDYLHRILLLSARPLKDRQLAFKFTIEAVAMPGVKDRDMVDMPSQRLALDDLEDYTNVIVGRNLYSPANQPPKFASSEETQSGYVNQRMSFSPDVDDPEEGRLTYRVEHKGLDGLSIDERSGRIEWTPSEIGEYEILVYATDDGFPAKEAVQSIHLAVATPPPPPPKQEEPPRRTFDEAKYTFVTGIVEVNGRRQVWLTVRTEGKWLRLYEGETFQIGAMDGKIVRIHPRTVEISTAENVRSVRFGQSLYDGQILSGDEEVAAAVR